ncbi:hypothetical protein NC651_027013 [Populus alba x Populus x berolinensis]|nr:hypothetical protein NC651_027013 [Populus alba x Populus x berolinensis]
MKKVVSKRELVIIMQFGCQQLRFLMVTFTLAQKITLTYLQFGKIVKVLLRRNEVILRCWESITLENLYVLEKLQLNLRKVINGVGGLSHEHWRSFNNEKKTVDAKNFLDGDLIETFLDLSHSRMEEIGKTMNTTVEELYERVEELAKLY